jgi:uncharacterized protein YciI
MIFLILLQYIKPHFAVDQYYPKHEAFLDKFVQSGNFLVCGRRTLKTGEFILCRANNRKEAEAIMNEDPFDVNQLAVYDMIEYSMTAYASEFGSLLGKKE